MAELTSRPSYVTTPRPRSASPYLYRPTYSSRFSSPRPLTPVLSAADRLEIELAVERARARSRARALALVRSRSPSPYRYTPSVGILIAHCSWKLFWQIQFLCSPTKFEGVDKNHQVVHLLVSGFWQSVCQENSYCFDSFWQIAVKLGVHVPNQV